MRSFLTKLYKNGELAEHNYNLIKPKGSQRPRLYGLPKTHKTDVPLRPILSLVGSAQHKVAKFLNFVLEPVSEKFSKYTIKDSFTFAEKIRNTPAENTYMVSFDVKSLFTSVPLKETIDICAKVLYENTDIGLSKRNFIALMNTATSGIEFSFDGEMYCQTDGVAMGSPLGPTLANIIMGYLESKYFETNSSPIAYYRYVDDCFILFRNKEDCDRMFLGFNSLHPSIKFTLEAENNNILPFLDVLVERIDTKFVTSVYRKGTFTGQYVNFYSHCTTKRKANLIRTLCERAIRICSPSHLDRELKQISQILQNNGYPEELINKIIQRRVTKTTIEPAFGPEVHNIPIKLPFLGSTSHKMEKHIGRLVRGCYYSAKARTIFTSQPNFTPAKKDPIPSFNKSMVIYHYKCHCGNDYIGQTSRRFAERLKEHVPKCVRQFIKNPTQAYETVLKLKRASNRSSIAKQLLKNSEKCGSYYNNNNKKFKFKRCCKTEFYLKVAEAV